jgi:hypothetical protein
VDLLAPWGLSGVTVTPAEHGTNNGTYLAGDRWVLRITQNLSLAQVRAEHRLLRRLGQAGLPFAVPVPVPAASGDTVVPTEPDRRLQSVFALEFFDTGAERTVMLDGGAQFLGSRVLAVPGG